MKRPSFVLSFKDELVMKASPGKMYYIVLPGRGLLSKGGAFSWNFQDAYVFKSLHSAIGNLYSESGEIAVEESEALILSALNS